MGFCYQRNFSNPTQPVDEAQFYALVRAGKWKEDIDKFRATGDQALKRKLPAFIFQATFDETTSKAGKTGRWRKQSATRLTGLVVMDIDHVEDPRKVYEGWTGLKELGVLLVYVTPSGRGLKVVFKADIAKGNLIDNQHAMAEKLGVVVDESCKDASRMSFICKEEDILFIDKELFTYENKEFSERFTALYRDGHSQSSGAFVMRQQDNNGICNAAEQKEEQITWRGYDIQSIIDSRYAGKLPCAADSNRHNESLKLASDLLVLFDGDKEATLRILRAQPWVQEIICERQENVEQTVASAAERKAEREKKYISLQPSKPMQAAIEKTCGMSWRQITQGEEATEALVSEEEIEKWLWDWGEKIEALFPYYPALKDACKGVNRNQYSAALVVSGALMMTLMTRCTYRFYHRPTKLRRLNCCAVIIGDPASGKSFATRLYEFLAAPIVEADRLGKETINRYREEVKTKGANKEKPKKPKVVVRIHPSRTSNAQFIQDMVNSVEQVDGTLMQLHMLTFDTELDNTLCVQKGGSWIDKQNMELKAFHNEEDGQAYSNADSIMQDFNVTWNYVYTGTPIALKKKVNEQNFGSGLATRLTCIPLPSTHYEMLDMDEDLDEESDHRLAEWAKKLDKTKGELSIKKIVRTMYDWTARRMADAKDNDSKADEMLLKRCAYHGINYSAPFILMRHWGELHQEGEYWCGEFETDEIDEQLAELIVNIQFACQRHFFGSLAEKYFDDKLRDASCIHRHHQKTKEGYSRLPDEFTTADVMRCFMLKGKDAVRMRIKRMEQDGTIVKAGEYEEDGTTKYKYKKKGVLVF
ncbi:MAG: hypothetical protein IJ580_10110 [Prevotella sp.]|nr:hypothetical protein [Prevotella sp.]MBR1557104.1 hypothetical protein [Prevotella sp.]